MAPSQPFAGPLRRLVLAFDVGTTYSGVAYAVLDPGEVPKIQGVTRYEASTCVMVVIVSYFIRYPGQENTGFKIPSILYYTRDGKVHAVGAEAASSAMELEAEDEDLIFVEWYALYLSSTHLFSPRCRFKLHLRPDSMIHGLQRDILPDLPPGKTAIEVFGDFLKYLYSCARCFITESHPNGESLWQSVGSRIDFIFGHPNGWEGLQQSKMRQAAVAAGLVTDSQVDQARVHFVSEGEASLHYCLDGGLALDAIRVRRYVVHESTCFLHADVSEPKAGSEVLIVDAGGGTVDLSKYSFVTTSPITVEEVTSPDCQFLSFSYGNRAQPFASHPARLDKNQCSSDRIFHRYLCHLTVLSFSLSV